MDNKIKLSTNEAFIASTVISGTKATVDEVQYYSKNHSSEIANIALKLSILEDKMLCKGDLDTFEHKLSLSFSSSLDGRIDKLEDTFKTYIKENVAMKSELNKVTKDTIDWVNLNSATKQDIAKLENTLLWKLVGFISLIVALTTYLVKS